MDPFRFIATASTADRPLTEVIACLTGQPELEGLLLMGSTAQPTFSPVSDYDLLAVMDPLPVPLGLVHTSIDHRLTEIYFIAASALDPILHRATHAVSGGQLPQTGDQVALYTWMQSGQIVFDRTGRLTQAQQLLQTTAWFVPAPETHRYRIWFGANYNLKHTQWIAASADPLYRREVDIRLLFTVYLLFCDYFHLRGVPWQGSKAALRWLADHDPPYLQTFEAFLDAHTRADKLTRYEQLVAQTLAPFGAVWPDEATAIQLADGSEVSAAQIERTIRWWEDLIQ